MCILPGEIAFKGIPKRWIPDLQRFHVDRTSYIDPRITGGFVCPQIFSGKQRSESLPLTPARLSFGASRVYAYANAEGGKRTSRCIRPGQHLLSTCLNCHAFIRRDDLGCRRHRRPRHTISTALRSIRANRGGWEMLSRKGTANLSGAMFQSETCV